MRKVTTVKMLCRHLRSDEGSAVAEFTMVGALLTIVTLTVLQFGLALYVRNVLLDSASEGARYGALADRSASDGAARTKQIITRTIGAKYATRVKAGQSSDRADRRPLVTVRVTAPLPLIGLIGFDDGVEVSAHGIREILPGENP